MVNMSWTGLAFSVYRYCLYGLPYFIRIRHCFKGLYSVSCRREAVWCLWQYCAKEAIAWSPVWRHPLNISSSLCKVYNYNTQSLAYIAYLTSLPSYLVFNIVFLIIFLEMIMSGCFIWKVTHKGTLMCLVFFLCVFIVINKTSIGITWGAQIGIRLNIQVTKHYFDRWFVSCG